MISVVVLTRDRHKLLSECLDSLEAAGAPARAEVVVGVNGGGDAETEAIRVARPWVVVVGLERLSRGGARNKLVDVCCGEDLYFLDDDAAVPVDFFDRLEDALRRHPDVGVLGGPNLLAEGSSRFQHAVDFLLRSPVGAGPMRRRYTGYGPEGRSGDESFMLSGLLVRRAVFSRGYGFDPFSSSAEENALIHDAEAAFGRGVYCPDLVIRHHRRAGWRSFLAQVFVNGRGRGEITRTRPYSFHLAALAPATLFVGILTAVMGWVPARAGVTIYAAAVLAETARMLIFEKDGAPAAWRLLVLFPAAHVAYATGLIAGLSAPKRR